MGSARDMNRRQQNRRRDTTEIQNKIRNTRRWVFERGYSTASAMVQRVLEPMSLLTTQVSLRTSPCVPLWLIDSTECLLYPTFPLQRQLLRHVRPRPDA